MSNPSNAVDPIIYPCDTKDMCELTFEMLDGYGDGWNGAYISIVGSNNEFTYSIGLEKEGLETVTKTISLCPDKYTFVWNSGEFDEEISFAIIFNEVEIYKAGIEDIGYMFGEWFLEYEINCGESIADIDNSSINLHPNPVNDRLYIETEVEVEEVVVYDVYGKCQELSAVSCKPSVIDVSGLNSGVYFVKVVTSEGETVKRIIKQ